MKSKRLTKAEKIRFDKARKELAKRIKPQLDAIDKSTQLSAKDYTVRINAKG